MLDWACFLQFRDTEEIVHIASINACLKLMLNDLHTHNDIYCMFRGHTCYYTRCIFWI